MKRKYKGLASATLGLALGLAGASPAWAVLKGQVICTEREPEKSPVHYRFENGGAQPEVILDLDFTKTEMAPRWEVGRTYVITIDDNFERAAPLADAMFAVPAECTAESKSEFRLTSADGTVSATAHLTWEIDPSPTSPPWTKAGRYAVQITALPAASPSSTSGADR